MFRSLIEGIRSLVGGAGPTGEEARHKARVICRYPVQCSATPDGPAHSSDVVDISLSGLRLEGLEGLKPHDILWVAFETGGEPVKVEVIWSRKRPQDGMILTGTRYKCALEGTWVHRVLQEVGLTEQPPTYQKRKHVRLASHLRAEVRDKTTGQYICDGQVENLSMGGVLIHTGQDTVDGQLVLVLIAPEDNYPILSLSGRTVRHESDGHEGHLVSVKFLNVGARDVKILKRYLFALVKEKAGP